MVDIYRKIIFWHVVFSSIANCRIQFVYFPSNWICENADSCNQLNQNQSTSNIHEVVSIQQFPNRMIGRHIFSSIHHKKHTIISMYKSNIYAFACVFIYFVLYKNNIWNECESLRFKSMVLRRISNIEWKLMIESRWVQNDSSKLHQNIEERSTAIMILRAENHQ